MNGYPTPDAPMRINVNGPMTMGQLARLYSNGDPNLSSQTQGYVDRQASIQGISGGVGNYFAGERQNASNQVAALQMQQQRAYELAGRANPANQYAQQLAIADQAGAMRQQDAQIQQAQAFATRQRQFAEPADGSTPHLSPLQTQEAARQGMGGRAYLADQRLGSLRAYVDPKTSGRLPTTGVSPEDLYAHSSFQNALKRDPERSGQIFEALTGTKFHDEKTQDGVIAGWHSSYMKQQIAQETKATDMFTKGIADRDFQVGPDGSLLQQGWTKSADPTRPGMVRSGAYEPLSNYNKTQATPSVMRRVMGAGAREHYALAKEKEDERLAAANQVGYSQEVSQSDTPGVFRSSAFARLQKKDPAKATMLYRQQMGQASNVLGADPNTPLNLFDRSY